MLKKYTFKSNCAGYNILFLGAVHGNEPAGPKAMFKVIEKFACGALSPFKGSVSFIPVCNPLAFERGVRQIDENLNRVLRQYEHPQTYEQNIANELVGYIAEADIIIDLHSTSCTAAEPFIFSDYPDTLADKLAAAQNFKYIVEGWPQIYAGSATIQDFSTGFCAHEYGKTCLTVECGPHFAETSVQNAYYVIMNTLLALGILEGYPSVPVKQEYIVMDTIIFKEKEGSLSRDFKHLDKVSCGEILAVYQDGSSVICPADSYVLLPKLQAPVSSEWFYLGHLKDKTAD